jgi:hypothetical protein
MDRGVATHRATSITRRELLATVPVALAAGRNGAGGGERAPRIAALIINHRLISFRFTSINGPQTT